MKFETGSRINAIHSGKKISGTIAEARPVYAKTDGCILITIALDEPYNSYGQMVDSLMIGVRWNGEPSSYAYEQDKVLSVE